MTKYDVITMGSGLVDAFVYTGVTESKGKISFPVGTKILIKNIKFATGGGGTNTATTFSYLGLKTGFLGKVGSGYNSKIILRELKKNKVDFLGVDSKEHTGYSIILVTNKKHRTILTFKGASDNLKFSEINLRKLKTKWFHFTSMKGESFKTQKKIIEFANKKGIKTSFNPSAYQIRNGVKELKSILKNTYVLTLNKEEGRMLVPKGDVCIGLHKLGPEVVVMTNGGKVGEVYDGKFVYKYYPNKVIIGGRTGAGDVFASTFITGLIKLKDIEKAIKAAMANAENVITTRGAKAGLLDWKEINKRIKTHTYKVKKNGK